MSNSGEKENDGRIHAQFQDLLESILAAPGSEREVSPLGPVVDQPWPDRMVPPIVAALVEPDVKETKVVSKCRKCGRVDEFFAPASGFQARASGLPMCEAFPGLPNWRLTQLLANLCEECQKNEP